ncbi:MAG: circadian clock protein KaiC [Thermoplasmata archaeon]|nr:circadian clock protein KaiC [Thermoplasmata archaeon]
MPIENEEDVDRCPMGIDGLDNILSGGLPRGSTVLLSGHCGTGKTSIGLEFLIHGAQKGEIGLFISDSESSKDILKAMIPYDFFSEDILKKGKLVFVELPNIFERMGLDKIEFDFEDLTFLVSAISSLVKEIAPTRLVIDSITSVSYRLKTQEKIREFIIQLGRILSQENCTTFLVSESTPGERYYSILGVEEGVADGVIHLGNLERGGDRLRTIQVVKMRGTRHSMAKYVLDLTTCGALIVPLLKGGGGE